MINVLHLLWIIPLSVAFGYFLAALTHVPAESDRRMDELMRK